MKLSVFFFAFVSMYCSVYGQDRGDSTYLRGSEPDAAISEEDERAHERHLQSSTPTIKVEAESFSNSFGVDGVFTIDVEGVMGAGNINTGDWMVFPAVSIPTSGVYTVAYRVQSLNGGGSLQLEKAGGTPVYGALSFPSTGSDITDIATWTTVSHTVTLSAGSQSFAIKATSGANWSINWFTITPASTITVKPTSKPTTRKPTTRKPTSSTNPVPTIKVEAENYLSMSGVETQFTTDVGGGWVLGKVNTGDWMVYSAVTIPTTGTYKVAYRVQSLIGGGSLQFEKAGGTQVYGTVSIPSTGSVLTWTTVSHTVTLSAGPQSFCIKAISGDWGINWFTITKV
jgi:endoglucanase